LHLERRLLQPPFSFLRCNSVRFWGKQFLVAAAVIMPWLAKEKRRLSGATGSAALRADATQSALCAYLSLLALAGLAINAI